MKLIPCVNGCAKGYVTLPDGLPYTLSRAPQRSVKGKCSGCKMPFNVSLSEFKRLPDLSLNDLRALGVADHVVLNDLRGQGMTDEHLATMEGMGVDLV